MHRNNWKSGNYCLISECVLIIIVISTITTIVGLIKATLRVKLTSARARIITITIITIMIIIITILRPPTWSNYYYYYYY